MRLITLRSAGWTAALLASTTLAHASSEIAQIQSRIDATLEQIVAAGPTAPRVTHSTHVQPTPRSISRAEAQLGQLAPEKIDAVRQAQCDEDYCYGPGGSMNIRPGVHGEGDYTNQSPPTGNYGYTPEDVTPLPPSTPGWLEREHERMRDVPDSGDVDFPVNIPSFEELGAEAAREAAAHYPNPKDRTTLGLFAGAMEKDAARFRNTFPPGDPMYSKTPEEVFPKSEGENSTSMNPIRRLGTRFIYDLIDSAQDYRQDVEEDQDEGKKKPTDIQRGLPSISKFQR